MNEIIVSSIICKKCYTRLISRYRHDYVQCLCGDVSLDGGNDYCKIRGENYISAHCFSNDSHSKIRFNFAWGSYGKNGDEPLHYILLCDMELSHIRAILDTQQLKPEIRQIFINEINYRT